MSEIICLSELKNGESARVIAVEGEASFRRRLCELGLTAKGRVSRYAEILGGKTAVYLTESGLIALRKQDASLVRCEREDRK